jgi:hypothetical protein
MQLGSPKGYHPWGCSPEWPASRTRVSKSICVIAVIFHMGCMLPAFSQAPVFQKTLEVGLKDPTILDVALSKSDVSITYSRDGQLAI